MDRSTQKWRQGQRIHFVKALVSPGYLTPFVRLNNRPGGLYE